MSLTQATGQAAEDHACRYLSRRGFKLMTRNYRAKTGEIDLIMSNGDLLIFVEVRRRTHGGYGTGADSITLRKQHRIINTAKRFLQSVPNPTWDSYRFDVISIGKDIDWIPGAFTLD